MIEALVFDLDDTLVNEVASVNSAFLESCRRARERYGLSPDDLHATIRKTCREIWFESPARAYCMNVGISSWEGLWAQFEGDDENLRILKQWSPTYRFESWSESLRRYGIDDQSFAEELAEAYIINRRQRHIVFGDAKPILESLQGNYKLGMLTNGAPDLQREKINGAGIGSYFDMIIVSGDYGIGKPDARIFKIILSANKAAMIGNSLKSDIKGAHSAGIKSIWLNRTGEENDESATPDMEIRGLDELIGIF